MATKKKQRAAKESKARKTPFAPLALAHAKADFAVVEALLVSASQSLREASATLADMSFNSIPESIIEKATALAKRIDAVSDTADKLETRVYALQYRLDGMLDTEE